MSDAGTNINQATSSSNIQQSDGQEEAHLNYVKYTMKSFDINNDAYIAL